MSEIHELGKRGEAEALTLLRKKGFQIRETNWRHGREEVDIIAESDDYLAIVEVKTRTTDVYGAPEMFVSKAKQRHLIRAANAYASKRQIDKDIYFDIIAIVEKPEFRIEHIHQAFYP